MKIEVKDMHLFEGGDNTKGICNVVFDDAIRIKGVRVMDGKKGLFAAMPSRQKKDGDYENYVQFPDKELQEQVNKAVVDAFEAQGAAKG